MNRFVQDLLERVVSTAAAAALAAIVATGATDTGGVNWQQVGATAALAGIVSALKGLAASRVGNPQSASLVQ